MHTTDEPILNEVRSFFSSYHIEVKEGLGIAFSGGSDSLGLLLALRRIFGTDALHALYVKHNIRSPEESRAELELNRRNCERLDIRFHLLDLGELTVHNEALLRGRGVEEAARHLRYSALVQACERLGLHYLATAHNADDQLETLLMRLFQPTSIVALEGIRPIRRLSESITLIRPTLGCTHLQLQQFVRSCQLTWSEDSTNQQNDYLRNAVRNRLVPDLLELFPSARSAALRMGKRFGEAGSLLTQLTDEAMQTVVSKEGACEFSLAWFLNLHPVIKEQVLYRITASFPSESRIRGSFIDKLIQRFENSGSSSNWLFESGGHRVQCRKGRISWSFGIQGAWSFCLPLADPKAEASYELGNDVVFSVESFDGRELFPCGPIALDADMLEQPILRSPMETDEILLEGGSVKVTKLLASYRIPRHLFPMAVVLDDRSGLVAVFSSHLGGRDRVAKRFKAPLAPRLTNIYSSSKRNHYSETESRESREQF